MPQPPAVSAEAIQRLVEFREDNPLRILGPHPHPQPGKTLVRAFLPRAAHAWVRLKKSGRVRAIPMRRIHAQGLYEAELPQAGDVPDYRVGFEDDAGYRTEFSDPYAYGGIITDYDLYLLGEGNHFQSYEKFGAHYGIFNGMEGVHFAVWAPAARSVSVVGNFNHWRAGAHPMCRIRGSGVWGLFIPGLKPGEVYKFALRSKVDGQIRVKADPYAFQSELRPHTASVVADPAAYRWQDGAWMTARASRNALDHPLSVYEVHLGSWRRGAGDPPAFLSYRELADQLVAHVLENGFTHLELLPVMEHPLDASWGYQVIGYYAPTSRFGSPDDFKYFVDTCHQHGLGVLLDWVPGHFPKDLHGLNDFDGTQLYAYANPQKGEHREWGTLVFDYGRHEVRNFLISNALFWLDHYHVDGLRVDAVASMLYLDYARKPGEWVPNRYGGRENLEAIDFLRKVNEQVQARHPGALTIAEESTAWPGVTRPVCAGGLGFSLKWNMGWMHDTLEYFSKEPVFRKYHQNALTFSLLYAFSEQFILPISHDEVVYGKRSLLEKMPGDDWQKFANLRLFFSYLFGHPGKKLLFSGCEFAQRAEWNSEQSLDWHLLQYTPHRQTLLFLRDLQHAYRTFRAFYERDHDDRGFDWIDFSDTDSSTLSFLRWSKDFSQMLVVVLNMTPVPRRHYRIGVPKPGTYREILNSDAEVYGGSGLGNYGQAEAEPWASHGRPYSLDLTLPPLAAVVFVWNDVRA